MVDSNVVKSMNVRQNTVLQNVVNEIGQDRQLDAELIRKQRLLGIQMNRVPAKSDRMNTGKQHQNFAPTRKFYRSRRK